MNYQQLYAISAKALTVEKLRLDLVANNIANQHSLQRADGKAFEASFVETKASSFDDFVEGKYGIDSIEVKPQNRPLNKVYQPNHPLADDKGYLNYPGINTLDEMTTLLRASRAYEANIKLINSAHSLYLQALHIGEER